MTATAARASAGAASLRGSSLRSDPRLQPELRKPARDPLEPSEDIVELGGFDPADPSGGFFILDLRAFLVEEVAHFAIALGVPRDAVAGQPLRYLIRCAGLSLVDELFGQQHAGHRYSEPASDQAPPIRRRFGRLHLPQAVGSPGNIQFPGRLRLAHAELFAVGLQALTDRDHITHAVRPLPWTSMCGTAVIPTICIVRRMVRDGFTTLTGPFPLVDEANVKRT